MNTNKRNRRKYNSFMIFALSLLMVLESSISMAAGSGAAYAVDEDSAAQEAMSVRTVEASVVPAALYEKGSNGEYKPGTELKNLLNYWKSLTDREVKLYDGDRDASHAPYEVYVTGMLPEGVSAEVSYIDTDEKEGVRTDAGVEVPETALYAFELKLSDSDGNAYVPEEPLTVEVMGDEIGESVRAGKPLVLYSYQANADRAKKLSAKTGKSVYAADVLVYRDGTDSDELVSYEPYDAGRKYDAGEDAVRYTEADGGMAYDEESGAVVFDYEFGKSLDTTDGREAAEETVDSADFVLSTIDPEAQEAAREEEPEAEEPAKEHAEEAAKEPEAKEEAEETAKEEAAEKAENADGADADSQKDTTAKADADAESKTASDAKKESSDEKTINKERSYSKVATDHKTYKISVSYGSDTGIPADAELVVKEIKDSGLSYFKYNSYVKRSAKELGRDRKDFEFAKAYDIKLQDSKTGKEYEPDGNVSVSIELLSEEVSEEGQLEVVHFGDEVEVMDTEVSDQTVSFDTEGFSVYVVAYTVDFHWGDTTYNLEGGSTIFLSELLDLLVEDGADAGDLQKIEKDLSNVKKVEFSDPELISVDEVEILDGEPELIETDETEELIEHTHRDWRLVSLAPFTTEELLTITLKSGEFIEIPVTDEIWGDEDGETITAGNRLGTRVTADGVTYNLYYSLVYGYYADVYSISANSTIHDYIYYNNIKYRTLDLRQTSGDLTKYKNNMDTELIIRTAENYSFDLPDIKTQPDIDPVSEDSAFVAGNSNDGRYKFWKKAVYNPDTNSIDYTMKYFQAMKTDSKIDFIFIYDDSASMYSGTRTTNTYVRLREAQTTRVVILDAVNALLPKTGQSQKENYDINVYLGGASSGHTTWDGPFANYDDVANALSVYRTGTTNHNTGVKNALAMAKNSVQAGRNPVVIYLSDFHQPGTLSNNSSDVASLKKIAQVYGLSTDYNYGVGRAASDIPSGASYMHKMNDIEGGVKELENIIIEAIGYYMRDNITVTDNLSDALSDITPGNGATSYTDRKNNVKNDAGSATGSKGKETWTFGGSNSNLGAGTVYTETFSVALDPEQVYAGSAPTNGAATISVNGTVINTIEPADDSPEDLHLAQGVKFVVGRLNEKGKAISDANGAPVNKINGTLQFTLTKQGESTPIGTYTVGGDGSFVIPFETGEGTNKKVILEKGQNYILQELASSVASYNNTANPKLVTPDSSWIIKVSDKGIITTEVNGAAGQTPEMTVAKAVVKNGNTAGEPSRFVIWNQVVVEATLIPIQVQKVWNSDEHLDPVPFTIYGIPMTVDDSGKVTYGEKINDPLPVFSEASTSSTRVQYITEDDYDAATSTEKGKTVWTKTVYVPDSINENGSIIKFYDQDKITKEELQSVVDKGNHLRIGTTDTTDYTPDQILAQRGTTIDGQLVLVCNQKYSYSIEEGHLIYEDGWYTPATSSKTVVNEYIGNWTTGSGEKYEWVPYDGDTSTEFQLHLNLYDLYYYGTQAKVSNFQSWFGSHYNTRVPLTSTYYTRINGASYLRSFYNNLYSVTLGIRDNADGGQMYKLTIYPGSSYSPTISYNDDYGVNFTGIKLPIEMKGYSATATYKRLSKLAITYIAVNANEHTSENDAFVLYGTDPENSSRTANSYTSFYDPDTYNDNRRTELELLGGSRSSSARESNTSKNAVSNSTLKYYKHTPAVQSKEAGQYLVNKAVLGIENTWVSNKLIPIDVVKNWENTDGTPGEEKQAINFSINGILANGEKYAVPIFTDANAAWSTGTYTQTLSDTNKDADRSTSNRWVQTYYVPTYDVLGTYDPNTRTSEAFTYTESELTSEQIEQCKEGFVENVLNVDIDEDGFGKGTWNTPIISFTQSENVEGYSKAEGFYQYYPDTKDAFFKFTLEKATAAGWFTGGKESKLNFRSIFVQYTANGVKYQEMFTFNSTETSSDLTTLENTSTSKRNDFYVKITIPSDVNINNITIDSIRLSLETSITESSGQDMTNVNKNEVLKGYSIVSGNYTYTGAPVGVIHKIWNDAEELEGYSTPATYTITNTYTPNVALTLESKFTDSSLDASSSGNIKKIFYTIKDESGNVVRTTSVEPTHSGARSDASKVIYLPKGIYSIYQSYTLEDGENAVRYDVDGEMDAYDAKHRETVNGVAGSNVHNAIYTGNITSDRTISFDNPRKTLPVQVSISWEPSLKDGEDPLADAGKTLNYGILYEDADRQPTSVDATGYVIDAARAVKKHGDGDKKIPTFSIREMPVECALDETKMKDALPDYDLSVVSEEKTISGTDTMVFTIEANIKRSAVIVQKLFDSEINFNDYKGSTLQFTIERSDGENIYGTNTKTVSAIMTVPDDEEQAASALLRTFVLQDDSVVNYRSGLDSRTKEVYAEGETIYLPVLRSSLDVQGGKPVKYILKESVALSNHSKTSYFPSFADRSNNSEAEFEQTNPAGKNEWVSDADKIYGDINSAQFILNTSGIIVEIVNASTPYICKIDDGVEHPFRRLNAALQYARENLDGKATIEMLVDYEIPGSSAAVGTTPAEWATNDRVELKSGTVTVDGQTVSYTDDITITTAATSGGVYNFVPTFEEKTGSGNRLSTDSKSLAILKRGYTETNQDDGALFTVNEGSIAFENIILEGNGGATQGRAVLAEKKGATTPEVTFNAGTVVRNFVTNQKGEQAARGGAVNLRSNTKMTISGSQSNKVIFSSNNIRNSNSLEDSNKNAAYGGAVYASQETEIQINWAEFTGNIALNTNTDTNAGGGGAIAFGETDKGSQKAQLDISNSGFTGNTADNYGGAIRSSSNVDINLTGCDFDGNLAQNGDGGAVLVHSDSKTNNTTLTVNNCNFTKNMAGSATDEDRNGGAIAVYKNVKLEIGNNTGFGGESPTDGNIAKFGGAVYGAENSVITIEDATFQMNKATENGGAIYAGAELTVTGGTFESNTAKSGGAIFVIGNASISNTTMTGNTATAAGGGAVNVGSEDSVLKFEGKVIIENNTNTADDTANEHNVVLDRDKNTVIQTIGDGLSGGAHIGVYVTGAEDASPYKDHGIYGMPFGTWNTTDINLDRFTNDRDEKLFGVNYADAGKDSDSLIYWGSYIARVRSDSGTDAQKEWKYFIALITVDNNGRSVEGAFNYANTLTGNVEIETLLESHHRYTLTEGYSFNKSELTKLTLRTTQDDMWNPAGTDGKFRSTIIKNHASSMITTAFGGTFETEKIILDGGSKLSNPVSGTTNGGIVNVTNGSIKVKDGTTMQNTATTGTGGAIYASAAASLTVSGSATKDANGAITDYGVEFKNCKAAQGGAIYQDGVQSGTGSTSIKGALFDSCETTATGNKQGGGAISTRVNSLTVEDSKFIRCHTERTKTNQQPQGGAILHFSTYTDNDAWSGMSTTVKNCIFDDCHANGSGGAMDVETDILVLTNTSFNNCTSGNGQKKDGGAVDFIPRNDWSNRKTTDTSLTVDSCTFTDCTTARAGGAIRSAAQKNDITDSKFYKCVSRGEEGNADGGALAFLNTTSGAYATISGSEFVNCETKRSDSKGGAIYSKVNTLTIQKDTANKKTKFINCVGVSGGAIYIDKGTTTATISDCEIDGHQSYTVTKPDGTTQSYTLADATVNAVNGGAIFAAGGPTTLSNVTIKDCTATTGGGAIYHNAAQKLTINSEFTIDGHESLDNTKNNATSGGAIYANGSGEIEINSGTIRDNYSVSGGAVYAAANANVTIKSGNITSNRSSGVGGAIFVTGGTVTIDGGEISGNTAGSYGGGAIRMESNANVTMNDGIIKENRAEGSGEKYGGAISIKSGTFTMTGGAIQNNTVESSDKTAGGGAIYASGNNTDNGKVIISDGQISGNKAIQSGGTAYGGGIAVNGAGASAEISGGTITGNSAENPDKDNKYVYGGAVYVSGGTLTLSGGTFTKNSVSGRAEDRVKGAGIYLAADGHLNISGNPAFGTGNDANTVTMKSYDGKVNGGDIVYAEVTPETNPKTYLIRQDIYTAESDENPASIVVTGELTGDPGSIWVWAESEYHYKQLMPFATWGLAEGVTLTEAKQESTMAVFRNARDDDTTENATDTYLFGTTGDSPAFIYWTGISGYRKVILRKVGSSYAPAKDKTFSIYKGSSTSAYTPKGETSPLSGLSSGDSGCFYIGELAYGTYIIEETDPHKFFYVIVDEDGVYGSLGGDNPRETKPGGYDTRQDALAAAKE